MTRAPDNLLAVRKLLLAHLDVDPTRARSIDLESAEVGIVGDAAHIGEGDSYHLGLPEQSVDGYSVRESSRDRALTEDACALDVGSFTVTAPKDTFDLPHFSAWCVAQCKAGAPDTRDIREIIWSPDGSTVRRWDRLGRRSTGDSSHRWHTHFSFHRDAIKAGRDLTPLFRRYLTTIGLIEAPNTEDDMTPSERWVLHVMNWRLEAIRANRAVIRVPARTDLGPAYVAFEEPNRLAVAVGVDDTDEQAIVAGVVAGLAGLDLDAAAAALKAAFGDRADELAARLAG